MDAYFPMVLVLQRILKGGVCGGGGADKLAQNFALYGFCTYWKCPGNVAVSPFNGNLRGHSPLLSITVTSMWIPARVVLCLFLPTAHTWFIFISILCVLLSPERPEKLLRSCQYLLLKPRNAILLVLCSLIKSRDFTMKNSYLCLNCLSWNIFIALEAQILCIYVTAVSLVFLWVS